MTQSTIPVSTFFSSDLMTYGSVEYYLIDTLNVLFCYATN
jgi:hypothetical protein